MGTLGPRTQEVRVALNLARGLGNVQRHRGEQQESTATWPSRIDLTRPARAYDLHQRPTSTGMQLVHTEGVARHPARPDL